MSERLISDPEGSAAEAASQWHLRPSPKYSPHGVVRVVRPAETIQRVMPLMDTFGVTRVADVTGLDRVGIPNFTSVRPRDGQDGISYYNGKGMTRLAAKAGALMEAVERHGGERCNLRVYYETRQAMERLGPTVDPAEIVVPFVVEYRPSMRLEWVEGFDILRGRPTYLPLNAVVCPYEPTDARPILYYASTNGLASGNTREEALCHALCEVIERDAMALASAHLDLTPAVAGVLASLGMSPPKPAASITVLDFPLIDPDSLPTRPLTLVRRLRRAGLDVYLRNITSTAAIPAVSCATVERQLDGGFLVHGGSGAHPDAHVAVARALTEAAQSRVGHIQGGREDLPAILRGPIAFDPAEVLGRGETHPFTSIRTYEHPNIDDDIRFMLDRLGQDGFEQVIAVDLTSRDLGIPVVRVVIPRAETWSVFFSHARKSRFAGRVSRVLNQKRSGRG